MISVKNYVRELKPYKIKKFECKTRLDSNENPFNIAIKLKADLADEIFNNLNRYPDSASEELRQALSNYTGLGTENIICGNGSDEIIKIVVDAFINPGDTIITHYPTFSMYKIIGEIAGAKVIEIKDDKSFNIQIDNIIFEANRRNAKLIFLCSPNNPTGTVIEEGDILKVLNNTKALVVLDEAYYEFYGKSMAPYVKSRKLLVLRTLSKAFGIAGLRVGYGLGNSELIAVLNKVKPPYNINVLSQKIATKLLEKPQIIEEYVNYIRMERKYLNKELKKINYIDVFPSKGNYILIKTNSSKLLNKLKEKSIGVRDYSGHRILDGYIRLSIGTRTENNEVLSVLKDVTGW